MEFLNQASAKDAVYTRTKQYKEIPFVTIRISSYKQVFNKLDTYDEAKKNTNRIAIFTALVSLRAALDDWMNKPDHVKEFTDDKSTSSKIKPIFAELKTELVTMLGDYLRDEKIIALMGPDIANILSHQLLDSAGYSAVSNPLLVLVLERLVLIYTPAGLTKDNFRQQIVNYIIADNDVRGSSSFLLQALGDKKSISLSIDFGKLVLPFLTLSLDLGSAKTTTINLVLLFDCLSRDYKENSEDFRYGFYRMLGWSREYLVEAGVTVGAEVSIGSSAELEVAGIKAKPSLDFSAKAQVKGSYTWTVMQVADLAPRYFTSMTTDETVDLVMTRITEPVPEKVEFDNKIGAVLNIYSNAYGGDAGVSASAKVGPAQIEVGGNAVADIRNSTIVLQSPARSIGHHKKTQVTQLWFKQLGVRAKVKAGPKQAEKSYDFVNAFSFETVTAYWNAEGTAQPRYTPEPRSGCSRGQSLIAEGLEKRIANIVNEDKYFSAIATQLEIDLGRVKNFFSANQGLIEGILGELKVNVKNNIMPESVLSSIVIEATFALKPGPSRGFTLNPDTNLPNNDIKETLTNMNDLYLQSIRLRVPSMGRKYVEKPGFKLGLNLGVIKFGIDLGMIENASTLAMTDIVISWFSSGGVKLEGTTEPEDYVPATALIM